MQDTLLVCCPVAVSAIQLQYNHSNLKTEIIGLPLYVISLLLYSNTTKDTRVV